MNNRITVQPFKNGGLRQGVWRRDWGTRKKTPNARFEKLHKKFFGRGLLFLGWGVSCVGNGLKKRRVLVGYDLFVDISNICSY